MLHAFKKKTPEIPEREMQVALRRLREFRMPWKEMTFEQVAKSLGVNPAEVREKHRLIGLIVKVRREKACHRPFSRKKSA